MAVRRWPFRSISSRTQTARRNVVGDNGIEKSKVKSRAQQPLRRGFALVSGQLVRICERFVNQ